MNRYPVQKCSYSKSKGQELTTQILTEITVTFNRTLFYTGKQTYMHHFAALIMFLQKNICQYLGQLFKTKIIMKRYEILFGYSQQFWTVKITAKNWEIFVDVLVNSLGIITHN